MCQTNNEANGAACGDTGTQCINQDTCQGGTCQDNGFKAAGSACGDSSDTECTNPDTCNGAGSCQANHAALGSSCGDAGTECVNQDTCSGAGTCTDNGFRDAGTACGDSSNTECTDPDTCNGAGACQPNDAAPGTNCGDTGTECVNQDTCNGSGTCTDSGFPAAGTACGDSSNTECTDPDTCDGGGACQPNDAAPGTNCGDTGTECINQDTCNGSGTCTDNGFQATGVSCGDSSNTECTDPDTCNGAGTCQPNDAATGTSCGDTGTQCVNQDTCNGSGTCTDNGFAPLATPCGDPSAADCDAPDSCDGLGACQDRVDAAGSECRPDAGACDVADRCDGSSKVCPNGVEPEGAPCGGSEADCDALDTCNGAGACVDRFKPETFACRAAAPGDAGACDETEFCTGASARCPADEFKDSTTVCRPGNPLTGGCDTPEECTGTTAACPADQHRTSGECDDGLFCTSNEQCDANGLCVGGDTCNDENTCSTDVCDEIGQACTHTPTAPPCEGQMTGGGQVLVNRENRAEKRSFGFNARGTALVIGGASGHFNYVNHAAKRHVNGAVTFIYYAIPSATGGEMRFAVTTKEGCTYDVTATDQVESGSKPPYDYLTVEKTGGMCAEPGNARARLDAGNIQWHNP